MTDSEFIAWLKTQDAIKLILVEIQDVNVGGTPVPFYLSNSSFVSAPTDTPANQFYTPCISGGVSFTETLSLEGKASISFGDIEIANLDGSKDDWLGYIWRNKGINVYMGDPRKAKSDFRLIFSGVINDITASSITALNLSLLSKMDRLNVPISEQVITDTEGKNQLIPLSFGECFNVTPAISNPVTLEYQVHPSAIEDIIEVRASGYPVSITKDLAGGKFTLTNAPYGTVTASIQGAETYTNTVAGIVQKIISDYGPSTSRLGSDIDSVNFSAFDTANPQPVGLYINQQTNKILAIEQLTASLGAAISCTSLGKFRLLKINLPVTASASVDQTDMYYGSLSIAERPLVKAAINLGYCKNWSVQTDGLAAGLAQGTLDIFKLEWYTNESKNTTTGTNYSIPVVDTQQETLLLTQADADNESDRRLALWGTQRMIVSADYYSHMLLTELGDGLTIAHNRLGLSSGKTGMVVQLRKDWINSKVTIGILI